jgi:hypothetical protein
MKIDPYTGKLTADKSQTKRFVEARILAEVARRNAIDESDAAFWEGLASDLKRAAVLVGQKHLDEKGYLIPTEKEARVNASVPG